MPAFLQKEEDYDQQEKIFRNPDALPSGTELQSAVSEQLR